MSNSCTKPTKDQGNVKQIFADEFINLSAFWAHLISLLVFSITYFKSPRIHKCFEIDVSFRIDVKSLCLFGMIVESIRHDS